MVNREKVAKFNKLNREFIEKKFNCDEPLPVMGSGPLNARVMVVGINGNMPEKIEEYRGKWDRPFLTKDNKPDYDKLASYNPTYMRFFLGEIGKEDVADKLRSEDKQGNNVFALQFQAMQDFKTKGEYYDKLGPALRDLLTKGTSYDEKERSKLQQMIRTCIFYTNAIKKPTHSMSDLSGKEWSDKDEKECFKQEIELIDPKIILCFGKDLYQYRNQRFKIQQRHCGSNDSEQLPQHYIDEKGRHIIFMYHFSRLAFWNRYNPGSKERTKEIFKCVNMLQELEDSWERKEWTY